MTKRVATIVSVVALVVYLVFIVVMLLNAGSQEELFWTRALYLFGGIETIAFAGAGYLLGQQVNRERAEVAEKRAETETLRANESQQTATAVVVKGQHLAAQVRDVVGLVSSRNEPQAAGEGGPAMNPVRPGELELLARTAKRLFPEA
jgi:hypothetical protein